MSHLSGREAQALHSALRSAFSASSMKQMVRFELDESFEDITLAGNFESRTLDLIEWAEKEGSTDQLVRGAIAAVPGNPSLKKFVAQYNRSVQRAISPQKLEEIVNENQSFKKTRSWRNQLERIEMCVCRIELNQQPKGTGFLVAGNILMTNHHVVKQVIDGTVPIDAVVARFDFHDKPNDPVPEDGTKYKLRPDWLLDASPHDPVDEQPKPKVYEPDMNHLDYAFVRLAENAGDTRGVIQPPQMISPLKKDGPLFIVQHPGGGTQSLALNTQSIVEVNEPKTRVRHRTNTLPGSSGSPCFDSDWNFVALHHSGDPSTVKPEYNEGIPIATIKGALSNEVRAELGWPG